MCMLFTMTGLPILNLNYFYYFADECILFSGRVPLDVLCDVSILVRVLPIIFPFIGSIISITFVKAG